jgi:tRNA A37 threonylcarbamoyladenosine synthetase subunit TsaC/SUA5/YrdC
MDKIFLAQTDTTVGLLSKNKKKLNKLKNRDENKPILIEVDSLDTLKSFVRAPKKHKKLIRRAKKTTFIYPNNKSFRVVKDSLHLEFLKKFKWLYSTSANEHKKEFDLNWAIKKADIIVEDKRGFFVSTPSKIYKLSKTKIKRVR